MAATEGDIIRDEQERSNWQRVIADVEAAIAASTPGTRRAFENTLESAKKRVVALDKRIEEAKLEHAAEVQTQAAAAAALAAKETKLSADERETYRGFLEKAYFTKKDFGKLDEFYQHSYDRLSEGGKNEMSKRFWEGVKRGEYQFGDAPSVIQQKEAERAKNRLGLNDLSAEQLRKMSGEEQRAFADAYNSDKRAEANGVLARSRLIDHNVDKSGVPKGDHPFVNDKSSSAVASIDLRSVDLTAVKLADVNSPPSAALIPGASASNLVERG